MDCFYINFNGISYFQRGLWPLTPVKIKGLMYLEEKRRNFFNTVEGIQLQSVPVTTPECTSERDEQMRL